MTKPILALLTLLLIATTPALAQEHAPASGPAHAEVDAQPHPVISEDGSWAGAMVIIVLGLFLAAAVIGPVVRANMPAEAPADHSHDDDHGAGDHHHDAGHGHGGGHGH